MKTVMIKSMIGTFALILTVPVYAVTPGSGTPGPEGTPGTEVTPQIAPTQVTSIDKAGVQVIEATGKQGVQIVQVTPGKPFANAGLEVGDQVLAVNSVPTNTIDTFGNAIANATGSTHVLVVDHNTGRILDIVVLL